MSLTAYLPQGRLWAITRGETLPDRTSGSAMLADISGFTPLTEGLQQPVGPHKGAEDVTRHLNAVFSSLIAEVERSGGDIISFAGDAFTCWFDQAGGDEALRATAAAFAMQAIMETFSIMPMPNSKSTTLSLKVVIATGPARRFVVGDPAIHYVDALAGTTLDRTGVGEHLARPGEILLDEAIVRVLGEILKVKEWRSSPETGERFAAAKALTMLVAAPTLPATQQLPPPDRLQAWLLYALRMREPLGQAGLLTEFRPCAVLFVRFSGIDFEVDKTCPHLHKQL